MQTTPSLGEEQRPASSSNPAVANSILVADCGTIFTKVSLLGLVEGQYRLMARGEAPTTVNAPYNDISKGITQAISEIEFITGRQFISNGQMVFPERPDGNGVDVFIATISAGGPIHLLVLGGVSPALDELSAQAVSGLYAETYALPAPSYIATSTPSFQAGGASASTPSGSGTPWTKERIDAEWERQLERVRELRPDAALIVGAADTPVGAAPLQEACQLIINAVQGTREGYPYLKLQNGSASASQSGRNDNESSQLPVLYAAAPQYVEAVQHMLNGYAEVIPVSTLTSQAQLGPTGMATTALYEREVIQRLPGYEQIRTWCASTPAATASSLSSLVRFLAQHYAMNVTAVDIGGSTTTLMMAREGGEFVPIVNTGVGVGPSIGAILQQAGPQRIARWLPFFVTEDELRQYVLNRMLHPQVIPTSIRDLQIGHAFAREAILLTLETAKYHNLGRFDADLILATGAILAHAPKFGQAGLILLDALQPRGVTSLVLDSTMLISQLGSVATVTPIAAVQVNENDAVTHRLGTCVVPYGKLPEGEVALRVGVEYRNGQQVKVEVKTGSIEVIPLRVNEQALLTLYPAPTVDVGLGPGERARAAEEIDGGLVGLIIDARGRPLLLPPNDAERHTRLLQWMQALGM